MKKIFTFLCILLLAQTLLAQKIDVESSPIFKSKESWSYETFVGRYNDKVVIRKDDWIEIIGSDLSHTESFQVDLSSPKKMDIDYDFMHLIDDRLVIYGREYEKSEKTNIYYAKSYDLNGQTIDTYRKVDEVKAPRNYEFKVKLNANHQNALVGHFTPVEKSKKKTENTPHYPELIFTEYDKTLDKTGSYTIELPYLDEGFVLHSTIWLNNNYYMLASAVNTTDNEPKQRKKKTSTSGFYVLKYDFKTGKLEEQPLNLSGVPVVSNLSISGSGDKIYVKGLWKKELNENNLGFIVSRLNAGNLEIEMDAITEFDSEVYKTLYNEKQLRKNKNLPIAHLQMQDFFVRSNGNMILIAEQNYSITTTTTTSNGTTSKTVYYSGPIIISEFTADGKAIWSKGIDKLQAAGIETNAHLSCHAMLKNDKVYIVYFDHFANQKYYSAPDIYNSLKGHSFKGKASLAFSCFEPDGQLSKGVLFNYKQTEKFKLKHAFTFLDSDANVMCMLKNGKKYKFMRVKLG